MCLKFIKHNYTKKLKAAWKILYLKKFKIKFKNC